MPEAVPVEAVAGIVIIAGFLGYGIASLRHANQQAKDWREIAQFNVKGGEIREED